MKILLANNVCYPYERGGAEEMVRYLAESWSEAGHRVIVAALAPGGHKINEIRNQSSLYQTVYWSSNYYNLSNISQWRRFIWHLPDWLGFRNYFRWRKILKKFKPDIVVLNNLTGLGFQVHHLCCRLGIPSVQVVHDVQYLQPSGLLLLGEEEALVNNWLARGYKTLTEYWLKPAKVLISPSQWLMDFYQHHNWLKDNCWLKLGNPLKIHLSSAYRLPNQLRQALFVGQLTSAKGIDWLAGQWSDFNKLLLAAGLPEASLTIIGDGPLLPYLSREASLDNHLRLMGRLEHDMVLDQLKMADVLIVPSFCYENWPTILLEAASSGSLAVVVSHGGAKELAEALGYLTFEAGNLNSLFNAWSQLSLAAAKLTYWPAGEGVELMTPNDYLTKILQNIS